MVELATNANPVMAVAAIGLTPRSPVMAEVGTLVMPDFDKTTKVAALPRLTGARVEAACAICPAPNVSRTANTAINTSRIIFLNGCWGDLFILLFPYSLDRQSWLISLQNWGSQKFIIQSILPSHIRHLGETQAPKNKKPI